MKQSTKKIVALFLSLISLFIGIFIYSFLRIPPFILNKLYALTKTQNWVQSVRTNFTNTEFPEWILYGLPDLLWMFSFMLFILMIWNFRLNRHSLIWIIGAICIGLAYEFFQLTEITPGVFDFKDIGYILTGALLALLFTIKIKRNA